MKNKRGISPLIATVLIIGFTIALAAIVMTWGGGFVRTTTEKTEASADMALKCSTQLDFEISSAELSGTTATVKVFNKGGAGDILSLKFRFYELGAMVGNIIETNADGWDGTVGVEEYKVGDFTLTTESGADKVEAIAVIADDAGGEFVCSQSPRERALTAAE